ncbi:MAG TPA: RNA methyltransferase [Candidatus Methanoperedens sp.]|nr:RNA methyltransferase [Candidatus Methanoperedens sp.]
MRGVAGRLRDAGPVPGGPSTPEAAAGNPLARIAIVLVEPREPGNVGATARAMANMGLSRLVLVRPPPFLVPEAYRMALAAKPILEGALVADDLGAALAGFGYVAGTTRRGGSGRRGRITPRALAGELAGLGGGDDAALLFGREDSGLTNEELQYCQRLVTIPSSAGFGSLNLAQSVLVLAYEVFLACGAAEGAAAGRRRATTVELENLYGHMERVLLEIGYLHPENPARMMRVFRRLFGRAGPDEREVRALRGICRQVAWYAGRPGERPGPAGEGDGG